MSTLTDLTEKAQAEIAEAFYSSAQDNAASSNGLLVAYEPDFETFPYQSVSLRQDRRLVQGNPVPTRDVFGIIQFLEPRCTGLQEEIILEDKRSGSIDSIHQVIDSGQDVVVGTDHLEIADIAYLGAGVSAMLRGNGAVHNSGIVLSKAASDYMGVSIDGFVSEKLPYELVENFLGAYGIVILDRIDAQSGKIVRSVPVREFLKLAVDLQFLVIPNTGSFANLRGIHQEAVGEHNKLVKKDFRNYMTRRGIRPKPPLVLYVAAPGTKNKPLNVAKYWQNMQLPTFHETIPEHLPTNLDNIQVVGRLAAGMVDYTQYALTYAGTIRLNEGETPIVRIDPSHMSVNGPERLGRFAERLIGLINTVDEPDGVLNIYDKKGNLPVIK